MKNYTQKRRVRRLIWTAGSVAMLLVSGNALAQDALGGSDLILPADAPPTADMVNLKTENRGLGSFAIVISNTGAVAVTGAIVRDTGGTGGFCAKNNPVTITGDGVPEGSFEISNLFGSGIALGTLQPGQSATLTYSCQSK